jgi:hypothetical protein
MPLRKQSNKNNIWGLITKNKNAYKKKHYSIEYTSSCCFFKRKGFGNNIHGTAMRAKSNKIT